MKLAPGQHQDKGYITKMCSLAFTIIQIKWLFFVYFQMNGVVLGLVIKTTVMASKHCNQDNMAKVK